MAGTPIRYVPRARYCETMGPFLMLWRDISRMGHITYDVITGMSVTQSVRGWAHSYLAQPRLDSILCDCFRDTLRVRENICISFLLSTLQLSCVLLMKGSIGHTSNLRSFSPTPLL